MLTFLGILILILILFVALLLIMPNTLEPPMAIMKESPVHGRGMFAARPIKTGDVIECAPLILFKRPDVAEGSIIRDYDIKYSDEENAIMLGHAGIYNHSDDSNAEWNFNSVPEIVVTAKRDIEEGEEVFVSYGTSYWANRKDKI